MGAGAVPGAAELAALRAALADLARGPSFYLPPGLARVGLAVLDELAAARAAADRDARQNQAMRTALFNLLLVMQTHEQAAVWADDEGFSRVLALAECACQERSIAECVGPFSRHYRAAHDARLAARGGTMATSEGAVTGGGAR